MPATIRLIFTLIILGALGYGGTYVLGNYVEPEQREIVKPISRDLFFKAK